MAMPTDCVFPIPSIAEIVIFAYFLIKKD